MARDRRRHLLADHVVGQQQRTAVAAGVEDVEHVLAVGGADHPLELEVVHLGVEGLADPGLQVVPAGEDQPLVLGQPLARLADAVEPHDGLGAGVEDQVPPRGLVVRPDPQQDQRADPRVRDVRVGEALQRLVHRFPVDALAGLGVVLHLDREVAADRLDEHLVLDRDVRVAAQHVVLADRGGPLEVVRRREDVVALAPVVHVGHRAVGADLPAQHPDVLGAGTGLEHRQHLALDPPQLEQPGVAVVPVQLGEVAQERRVAQQAGQLVGARVLEPERLAVAGEPVQREHVVHGRLGLEPDEHVVPEQHQATDLNAVPGNAVVRGPDAFGADEPQLGPAEHPEAFGVQLLGAAGEPGGLFGEPGPQHLVGARVEPGGSGCGALLRGGHRRVTSPRGRRPGARPVRASSRCPAAPSAFPSPGHRWRSAASAARTRSGSARRSCRTTRAPW